MVKAPTGWPYNPQKINQMLELDFAVAFLVGDAGREIDGVLHDSRECGSKMAGLLLYYFNLLRGMFLRMNKLGWFLFG